MIETTNQLDTLFQPYKLSDELTLKNRILMAPLTRCMADDDLVPTDTITAYYTRRADAGLIISEATIIEPDGQGYPNTPGIYSQEQIDGWRKVTDSVHKAGGKMFLQLWHVGRVSNPFFLDGKLPVAPSAVPLEGRVPRTELAYGTPRALEANEIEALVAQFSQAAKNAMEAGFDGVEIHGANGYLIDQFLHYHTNRREDEYGGSAENMVRFPLAVVKAVSDAIGAGRVGIRLSPAAYFNMEPDTRDPEVFRLLLEKLNGHELAYIHTGMFDDSMEFDYLEGNATSFLRKNSATSLVGCGSYTPESAAIAIDEKKMDLIALGRPFIANPDLVSRLKRGAELVEYNEAMLPNLY